MKKFTRDETVKILHESSIAYREKLAGRVFAVSYQDSSAGFTGCDEMNTIKSAPST